MYWLDRSAHNMGPASVRRKRANFAQKLRRRDPIPGSAIPQD
jgi:hypothetical protein